MLWWGSAFAGAVPVQGKLCPQRPLRAAITVLQPETQVERVGIRAVYSVQCRYQTVKFPVGGCGKCHLQFGIRAGGGSQVFQFHIPQGQVYPHAAGGQYLHIGGGFGGTIQAFVPLDLVDTFIAKMNGWLGEGSARHYAISDKGAYAAWL